MVETYSEANATDTLADRYLGSTGSSNRNFWLGLQTLNDLTTNTLESASGDHVSLYSGFWADGQPNVRAGKCVKTRVNNDAQSWELTTCENLLPFVCSVDACTMGSKLCSNGKCVNEVSL